MSKLGDFGWVFGVLMGTFLASSLVCSDFGRFFRLFAPGGGGSRKPGPLVMGEEPAIYGGSSL